MKKQELCIYAPEGDFIARLWFDGEQVTCSPETSKLFREAVEYLLLNESLVMYNREGDVVVEQLFGHSERSLDVLSRYYRYSMGFTTNLVPCLDVDLVKRLSTIDCASTRNMQSDAEIQSISEGKWERHNEITISRSDADHYSVAA